MQLSTPEIERVRPDDRPGCDRLLSRRPSLDTFLPDGERAAFLSRRLAKHLARSLSEIVAELSRVLPLDEVVLKHACHAIAQTDAVDSAVYAAYFDLLAAVRLGEAARAAEVLNVLPRLPLKAKAFHVVRWGDPEFAGKAAAFSRQLTRDASNALLLADIACVDFEKARGLAEKAMGLLDRAVPEVSAEVRELVRELVFARGEAGQDLRFDGATSLYCWGALFLNVDQHTRLTEMIDGLAHESAHAHLFGVSLGKPFVLNSADEVYPSPLRSDPRPLDGIFHAAFVSARMHYVHTRMLDSGVLAGEEAEAADEARAFARQAFYAGLATLDAHASLTALGRRVMRSASEYIGSS